MQDTSTVVKKDYLNKVAAWEKSAKNKKKEKPAAYTFTATDGVSVNGNQTYNVYRESLQKDKSNKTPLQIRRTGIHSYDSPDTVTVRDVTGKIVGKMIVICAKADKSETVNLVKVYLGSDRTLNNDKSPAALLSEAVSFMNNQAYNQLFAEFKGDKSAELIISDEEIRDYLLKQDLDWNYFFNEKGEIRYRENSNIEEGLIEEILKKQNHSFSGKTVIVIANRNIEPNGNSRTSGYYNGSNNFKNFCVILNSGLNDYTTYTHELGHVFGLGEAFYDFDLFTSAEMGNKARGEALEKGFSRSNYMDYSTERRILDRKMFFKTQIQRILSGFK